MKSGTRYHKYALRLLHLYPQAWRERYADEAAAVLEERPATPGTLWDLLMGMLDAHLHLPLFTERKFLMQQRVRDSQVAIFCSFLLFALVWLAANFFYNLFWTSDQFDPTVYPGLSLINSNLTQVILNICGISAVLALLIGVLPLISETIRQAFRYGHRRVLNALVLWMAGIACIPMLFFVDNRSYVFPYGNAIDDLRNLPYLLLGHPHAAISSIVAHPLSLVLLLLLAWVFVGAPICLIIGTRKTEFAFPQTRIASIAALLTTVAMSIMLAAMAYLAIGLHIYAPDFITGRIIALNVGVLWMALLTVLAYGALWRSLRAQRALVYA